MSNLPIISYFSNNFEEYLFGEKNWYIMKEIKIEKKVNSFQVGSFVSCEKVEFLCKFIGLFIVLCPASFGTHTLSLGSALQLSKCTCVVLLH